MYLKYRGPLVPIMGTIAVTTVAVLGVSDPLGQVVAVVLAAAAAFVVHALGHYYAGRHIAEIPAAAITVDPGRPPQHVALRDGDTWVTAAEPARYRDAYEEFDPTLDHFERFLAGGDIVQTAVVVPAALLLATLGFPTAAGLVVVGSLAATALLVAVDAATTRVRGEAAGDYSALWGIEWRVPLFILLGVVLVHLGVFWVVA